MRTNGREGFTAGTAILINDAGQPDGKRGNMELENIDVYAVKCNIPINSNECSVNTPDLFVLITG